MLASAPFRRAEAAAPLILAGAILAGLLAVFEHTAPVLLSLISLILIGATCYTTFRRPDLLVPLIVATTPLEITKIYIPILKASTDWFGYDVSLLDAGRLAMLLAAAIWALRALQTGRVNLPRDHLFGWAAALVAIGGVTLTYSLDPNKGRNELIRLCFNFLLMVMVAAYAATPGRQRAVARTWIVVGAILAVVALAQFVTGFAFWNPKLQEQGDFRRINATFADPNTFASFLNVGAAFALSFLAARRTRFWLWAPALGLLGVGLVVTFSRSGWVAFGLMILLWGLFFARTGRQLLLFLAFLASGAGIVAAAPGALDRIADLGGVEALSVRPQLIAVGLLMFAEQPLTGLGLGSFQAAVTTSYAYAYPFFNYVTASHTSIVTTAAEQGVFGLLATLGLLGTAVARAYLLATDRWLSTTGRACARALVLGLFVLVVAGQTTGALFEEPYTWIVLGMLIGLRRAALRERGLAAA